MPRTHEESGLKAGHAMRYIAGVDIGGTFTDLVLVDSRGTLSIEKVPSNPTDIASAFMGVLEKAERTRAMGRPLVQSLTRLVHGSTVAANAFLERKGARMGFITTKGTRDTLVMRRMYRENMYDTRSSEPPPLVTRDNVFEVEERVDHKGRVVTPLNEQDVYRVVEEIKAKKLESIGICFLFSFRNPAHELRVKEILKERLPDVYLSISYDVCPEIRDFERASTTHLNAYLQPPVDRYLRDLDGAMNARQVSATLQVMHSYGGVTGAKEAADKAVNLLLSGPAGGVIGSAYLGKLAGFPNIISFDMGGTSCDISLIRDATPTLSTPINATSTHCKFEGWDVLIPFIDIHTIGSGGGSVTWLDEGQGIHVGPESAGAVPGPACYGKGGTRATVTDADVLLGYIDPAYYLGGQISLDVDKARTAVAGVAKAVGLSVIDTADGIFRIINTNMINGIRVVSVERGHDPRNFALLSFGGAGGCHATALIDKLEIDRVIVPQTAAAFSAFGLLCTDLRRDYVTTVYKLLTDVKESELRRVLLGMTDVGFKELRKRQAKNAKIWYEISADMRYRGQGHDIRVSLKPPIESLTIEKVAAAFNEAYKHTYGYLENESEIQLINLRAVTCLGTARPQLKPASGLTKKLASRAKKGARKAYFGELRRFVPTDVYDGHALAPGNVIKGPAIVELETTTVVVRPEQSMRVDRFRNFIVGRKGIRP